jgi:hypothetical protein
VQNAEHICAGDIDLEIDSCDGNWFNFNSIECRWENLFN